jgi:hypothetical protein
MRRLRRGTEVPGTEVPGTEVPGSSPGRPTRAAAWIGPTSGNNSSHGR